jgi:hypothetical protein
MSLSARFAFVTAATLLMTACATHQPKYAWGTYDRSLYVYYKDPATVAALAQNLEATINAAEKTHAVVAPGLYAEYGYLLLQQGNAPGATDAFRKEETLWPESKAFMDRMIQASTSHKPADADQRPQ